MKKKNAVVEFVKTYVSDWEDLEDAKVLASQRDEEEAAGLLASLDLERARKRNARKTAEFYPF
jgi:hypothetical protein